MANMRMDCPICNGEIEVYLTFYGGDPSINDTGAWEAEGLTRSCSCTIDEDAVCEQAEAKANDDPEFGCSHIEPDYEPW